MREIANKIYIEESYAGVVLGAIELDRGLILIDVPLLPADRQSWRARVNQLAGANESIVVMLDTHIDRTIGLKGFDATIVGHEHALEILHNRPVGLHPRDLNQGAQAEIYDLPVGVQWAFPDMCFTENVSFYSNWVPIILTHQPGAHLAGCWVKSEVEKVLFVGDSVVVGQPPFLAWSDLDIWLDELDELLSDAFQDYKIVASRNGLVRKKSIEKFARFLRYLRGRLIDLSSARQKEQAIAELVPDLLRMLRFDRKYSSLYTTRLISGLSRYLKNREITKNFDE